MKEFTPAHLGRQISWYSTLQSLEKKYGPARSRPLNVVKFNMSALETIHTSQKGITGELSSNFRQALGLAIVLNSVKSDITFVMQFFTALVDYEAAVQAQKKKYSFGLTYLYT